MVAVRVGISTDCGVLVHSNRLDGDRVKCQGKSVLQPAQRAYGRDLMCWFIMAQELVPVYFLPWPLIYALQRGVWC